MISQIYIVDNNSSTTRFPDKIVRYIIKMNNNSMNNFKQKLTEIDWSIVINTDDPCTAYDIFDLYLYITYVFQSNLFK